MKTFGEGYTYRDLVKSCSGNAKEGITSLNTGIDEVIHMNYCMIEFNTDMSGEELLEYFGKTLDEFRHDVAQDFIRFKREIHEYYLTGKCLYRREEE